MIYYKSELLTSFPNIKQGFLPNFNHEKIGLTAKENGLSTIQTAKQIHSDRILKISDEDLISSEGDSLYTDLKGVGVGIYTADCLPIIYFAEDINIVGAIHAGWRGTLSEITSKTINYLIQELNCKSSKIYVAAGPGIEGNCYEIGEEVAEKFINKFDNADLFLSKKNSSKFNLDLKEANYCQLQDAGITNIDMFSKCTFCDETLPSYRRDGSRAGRILSFIGFI